MLSLHPQTDNDYDMIRDLLQHRRAIRYFDPSKPIDPEQVRTCLQQATLAPTSSNMQLWECYHITDKQLIQTLAPACLGQSAVTTADQLVVFCTTPQKWRERAQQNLAFQRQDIPRHFPADKQAKYIALQEQYYGQVTPFLYSRGLGIWGLVRKVLVQVGGLFRPVPRQVSEGDVSTVLHKSCALVIQSFMLGMSEAGYDTCPLEGFDSLRVKKVLGLPRATEVSMIVACGVRSEECVLSDRFRVPFEQQYHRLGK